MKTPSKNSKAQKEIKISEIRYRRLFESAQDGILILDAGTGCIIDVNPYLIEMLEYSKEELVNKQLWEIGAFKDILKSKMSFKELQEKEYIHYDNLPLETKNGKHIEYEFVSNVYQESDRKVIQCNIRDNTARKLAEELKSKLQQQQQQQQLQQQKEIEQLKTFNQQMKESEEKYRTLIENLNEGIWLLDKDNITTYVNTTMSGMLGYTVDEMIGKSLYYFMDEAGKIIAEYNVERRKKGIKEEHLFEFVKKDGSTLYASLTTGPILDKNGNYAGAIAGVIDISQRKKMEEEKEIIQNRLFQSQKINSIGTLAGGIAHDFNNLLNAIRGYTELLILRIGKENPLYNDLNEITVIVDKAAELTRQLLLFGRKCPMNIKMLDLNNIITAISKMIERIISANIEAKINLQPDIWSINADESQIEQVIMNVFVNAQDAMPNGGILTVKTENVTLNQECLMGISEAHSGMFVQLSIQDTGVGMSSEIIHKIFDPFFTTKHKSKGTGLGLSVVDGIIKRHDGWITINSEPGKGTLFNIYLPAFSEKRQCITEEVSNTDVAGHGERILFIEDEKDLLECISRALSMNGYVVIKAGNAKEAFETYEKENGNFQLVICDVMLPDKPGPELVGQFFSDNPELKVIFTSGYIADKSQYEKIYEKGRGFLQKPFKLNSLFTAVKEALEGSPKGTSKE